MFCFKGTNVYERSRPQLQAIYLVSALYLSKTVDMGQTAMLMATITLRLTVTIVHFSSYSTSTYFPNRLILNPIQ